MSFVLQNPLVGGVEFHQNILASCLGNQDAVAEHNAVIYYQSDAPIGPQGIQIQSLRLKRSSPRPLPQETRSLTGLIDECLRPERSWC